MNSTKRGAPDFLLLVLAVILVGFGLVMVFSASSSMAVTSARYNYDAFYFTKKQALFAIAGTVIMFVTMNIRYDRIRSWGSRFFLLSVGLLILVLLIGETRNGAKSWFMIAGNGIQPTEFAKIGIILYLASLITKKAERIMDFKKGLMPLFIILGFVSILIMLQPDLGSCAVLLLCSFIVIIAGGANLRQLGVIFSLGAGLIAVILVFMLMSESLTDNYRFARFTAFLNPWEDPLGDGYHLRMSLYAFGHGGLAGAGFGQSIQKLHYLPYPQNDFIFSVIGEEFGFIGSFLFLFVYLLFIWRGIMVSLRSPDTFGTLTGIGIMSMFAIQALINIGGVTGSIPLTGVTLPLISQGGSSLLACMFGIGILLSISRETHITERNGKQTTAKRKNRFSRD